MGTLFMKQKALSIRENYELYCGDELKYIIKRRKLMAKMPIYDIFKEEGTVGSVEVVSKTSPLTFRISLNDNDEGEIKYEEIPGVNKLDYPSKGITIDGNSILSEFVIKDAAKKTIGTIKKKIVSVGDTYDIAFENDVDELLFAALALVTDETFHG